MSSSSPLITWITTQALRGAAYLLVAVALAGVVCIATASYAASPTRARWVGALLVAASGALAVLLGLAPRS